ncbi:MAG: DUF2938 family protein [Pseudomonadota bacterium]
MFEIVKDVLIVGIAATLTLDIVQQLMRLIMKWPISNWAIIGRWAAYLPEGRFVHKTIGKTPPVKHELALGWLVHYGVGIAYGAIYLFLVYAVFGTGPGFVPAMLFGILSVSVTWFMMEPILGAGNMGANTPDPTATRIQDFGSHFGFGLGLYFGGLLIGG